MLTWLVLAFLFAFAVFVFFAAKASFLFHNLSFDLYVYRIKKKTCKQINLDYNIERVVITFEAKNQRTNYSTIRSNYMYYIQMVCSQFVFCFRFSLNQSE